MAELIPLNFNKIMQSKAYTVFVLGTDEKRFAIYADPSVGGLLQMHLAEKEKPRPYTHDLINCIFSGLKVKVLQVVLTEVQDTVYFARLFVEQKINDEVHVLEIDARPSDCLTLALINNVPIFCRRDLIENVIPLEE